MATPSKTIDFSPEATQTPVLSHAAEALYCAETNTWSCPAFLHPVIMPARAPVTPNEEVLVQEPNNTMQTASSIVAIQVELHTLNQELLLIVNKVTEIGDAVLAAGPPLVQERGAGNETKRKRMRGEVERLMEGAVVMEKAKCRR